jgi:hypothetical protein
MTDKYRLHAYVDVRLDEPLDGAQALIRIHQAFDRLGDLPIHVACEGPIREDTGR